MNIFNIFANKKSNKKDNRLTKSAANSNRSKNVKKVVITLTTVLCIMSIASMTVFAASGSVNTQEFINKTILVLQSIVSLIGAGLAVWGVVNLVEGYSGDNAASKSQGIKQLMTGLGLVLVGLVVVPVLGTMMRNAMA